MLWLTRWRIHKTNNMSCFFRRIFAFSFIFVFIVFGFSCNRGKSKPVIVWTNQKEFASYAELFNASQDLTRVMVIYKEKPVESLPVAKDEQAPDIVIGPLLKNQSVKKNFRPMDYLFSEQQINPSIFYPQLLNTGYINDKQYLLPVSFNIPAVIFSKHNKSYVQENHIINLDQIKDIAATYNKTNKSGIYTHMGFAPNWDSRFMHLVANINNVDFKEKENLFSWNDFNLDKTVNYLRDWTKTANTSTSAENDFEFKYLYTPSYKQVVSGRCLFAYTTSAELFALPEDQLQEIDFRWIHNNGQIPLEDDMVYLGLYKKANNPEGAEKFIAWLTKEETQRNLLERSASMNLSASTFGISGGFSAIKNVNERIFPLYYKALLGNIPAADYLNPPNTLPPRWESLKSRVVIPWLENATDTAHEVPSKTMDQLITEWSKQFN